MPARDLVVRFVGEASRLRRPAAEASRDLKSVGGAAQAASAQVSRASKAQAESVAQAQRRIRSSVETANKVVKLTAQASADATRRVVAAEQRLAELRSKGAAGSQITRAEGALLRARRASVSATDRAAAATKRFEEAQKAGNRELAKVTGITGAVTRGYGRVASGASQMGAKTKAGFAALAAGGLVAVAGVAGVVVGISRAVSKAGAFQSSMRGVGTQLGVTGKGLADLTDLAVKMGAETSFSAQGASDAMLELAKGGLSAAQIRAGALAETLTLATAGGLELGNAASYMVQGLSAFGLKANQAGQVSAALAGAANASTASVESMGQALSQVGAGARIAGLSIQDTTAALAAFDNAGVKGSDAGTSLKTLLTRLVPASKQATQAMQDLGLITAEGNNQFFDAHGKIKSIVEVSGLLQKALKDQTREQKIATLSTIFGADASRAAAILAEDGAAGLAKFVKATSDSSAANDLARSATQGYAGALERFKGAVETAQIQLGTKFLPIVTKVLDYLSGPGMSVFQGIGSILADTFAPALNATTGAFGKFIDYLATHQAAVVETFKAGGDAVFNFAKAVARMASNGLRSLGDFAVQGTGAVLNMIGSLIRGFDAIPGIDLSESIAEFDKVATSAATTSAKTQNSLYEASWAIDKGMIPSLDRMQGRFDKSANTQIVKAEQRDALEATTRAIEKIGTASDGSQVYLTRFADRSKLSASAQDSLQKRIDAARGALKSQLGALSAAGAGQKALTGAWKEGKAKLYDEFVQMGISKREAQRLADKYAGIKPKVKTKFEQPGMAASLFDAKAYKTRLDNLPKLKSTTANLTFKTNAAGVVVDLNKQFQLVKGGPKMTLADGGMVPRRADGGQIRGQGGPRQDNIAGVDKRTGIQTAWVSAGEFVVNAKETKRRRRLIEALNRGASDAVLAAQLGQEHGLPHRANGGRVPSLTGPDRAHTHAATRGRDNGAMMLAWNVRAQMQKIIDATKKATQASGNFGRIDVSQPRALTSFRGHTFTNLFAASLRASEVQAKRTFSIYQGGFRPRTSYSGTSHQGDAIDARVDMGLLRASRSHGIAMWDRTGKGNWVSHMHGVPLPGAGYPAGSAVWQGQDYLRGGDGLRNGGPVLTPRKYDTGGWVPPGDTLVRNQTSKPELLLNPEQQAALAGGGNVNVTVRVEPDYRGLPPLIRGVVVDVLREKGIR